MNLWFSGISPTTFIFFFFLLFFCSFLLLNNCNIALPSFIEDEIDTTILSIRSFAIFGLSLVCAYWSGLYLCISFFSMIFSFEKSETEE